MNVTSFLQPFVDWIESEPVNQKRFATLMLVSNDKAGPARYAEGQLRLQHHFSQGIAVTLLQGKATLYESNERWNKASAGSGGFPDPDTTKFPFDPDKVDSINVSIDIHSGEVRLSSLAKGSATISAPQCEGFLLFGFATDGAGALGVGGSVLTPNTGNSPTPGNHAVGEALPITHAAIVRPYYVLSLKADYQDIAT